MKKVSALSFVFFTVLFFGHFNHVFSQEKQDAAKLYNIEIYSGDGFPVRLEKVTVEQRISFELNGVQYCEGIYKYTITNLTNIEINEIQIVKFVFDQNWKRISTEINRLTIDLEPFATKEFSTLVYRNYNPINPEHRTIIAINSVVNVYEVWDLSIREIERAVTAFIKGKYVEPLKVRHTKLFSL